MKIVLTEENIQPSSIHAPAWSFLPDSAIANAGKPFFIPDFSEQFVASLAPLLKIGKLGKSVPAKFATRYYSEIIPAVHFRAPVLLNNLRKQGLPADKAFSFDRSIIASGPINVESVSKENPLLLLKNGTELTRWHPDMLVLSPQIIVEKVSAYNTLKTGDLINPALSECFEISEGDRLEISHKNITLLMIAIK